ncbi:RNA polymerase sigma-B factor/anti-sigma B factor antagonist [Streptomyces sp. DvalAA-14]|uniref:STAS domain-containing protein n=1 Tax=unclassified Streptomyces TaxID=2593676 RepID=UPI00081B4246|nr:MULTISPECIES: STAS domain-containing protein [unclassified Streptomyces]MYS20106.1 anti-sigma factor antagonist [Streptomyces sp. SID4948]SCD61027.1 RNA polymerase sigma-B factor/anti-sigma B factor antagonist [Streptomyces sp. DvalAA-14]
MTAPALQVRAECAAPVSTLALIGELDLDGAAQLRAALADCYARRPRRVLLDLRDLWFCDCAGLNVLLEAAVSARGLGAELRLENVRPQVARLFTLVGVDEVFATDRQRLPPRIL